MKISKLFLFIIAILVISAAGIFYFVDTHLGNVSFESVKASSENSVASKTIPASSSEAVNGKIPPTPEAPVTHIATPSVVKAVYISAWTAGSAVPRDRIISLIGDTELNAVVIDVKDSTGRISFDVNDPYLKSLGSEEQRIKDVRALTNMLHQKNIYIIGRISVFQDSFMTKKKPDWAIKKKSDGTVWKDHKGFSFMDPANKEVWKYTVDIAKEAYADGFDEINFDYVRYPSDGNLKDINYHIAKDRTRADNMKAFFAGLNAEVKKPENIPMSADLFGLTTTETNDMGIGQIIENALPYFDFIAPMVYPSHFATGWNGFKIPADKPYEVVNTTMKSAMARAKAIGLSVNKIRPWLQDFSIKDNGYYVKYTPDMVRAQMKATYDAGLPSWMLWDPNNKYTKSALLQEGAPSDIIRNNEKTQN